MNRSPATTAGPVSATESDGSDPVMSSLLDAAHALEARLEHQLAAVGLSMSKLGVLAQLVEAGVPLPLSALATRLCCVRSNITQLVDRLEADGLVRRVDDAVDRRSVLAQVTELGAQRQRAGAAELAKIREQFAQSLPASDRAVLGRILAALG